MAKKFLTPINLAQNELQNARVQNLGSAPGSPVSGQIYYDTGLNQFGSYNGSGWVYLGSGGGTVTTVSVVSANGFAGTVANATSSPAITLTTSISGILKGSSSAIVAATSGTDYAPATSGSSILKGNGSGGFSSAVSNTDYAPVASPTFTGTVTVPTPSTSGAAATKGYVDGLVQGISNKYSASAATVGTETFTVTSGSVTQITGTTVDGQSPAVNDYILIKDAPASTGTGSAASTQPGNGLYQVTSNTTNLSVSRAADMSGTNAPAGSFVFIEGGTANAASGWVVSTPSTNAAFTYGTTAMKFTQFSGAGEVTAGTGLTKTANTISLTTPVAASSGGAGTVAGVLGANGSGTVSAYGYAATIGDGSSTSITVTHSLGSRDVIVMVYDASTFVYYECDITATSTSVVTLGFTVAPSSSSLRVVVIRAV